MNTLHGIYKMFILYFEDRNTELGEYLKFIICYIGQRCGRVIVIPFNSTS